MLASVAAWAAIAFGIGFLAGLVVAGLGAAAGKAPPGPGGREGTDE